MCTCIKFSVACVNLIYILILSLFLPNYGRMRTVVLDINLFVFTYNKYRQANFDHTQVHTMFLFPIVLPTLLIVSHFFVIRKFLSKLKRRHKQYFKTHRWTINKWLLIFLHFLLFYLKLIVFKVKEC